MPTLPLRQAAPGSGTWPAATPAAWCVWCGGGRSRAVHLHSRDDGGRESLQAVDVAAAVGAVRSACPGIPVGASTGVWMTGGDVQMRRELLQAWGDLAPGHRPDFASVNVSEPGFAELSALLVNLGIEVEAGISSPADVTLLSTVDEIGRILVEVIDVP